MSKIRNGQRKPNKNKIHDTLCHLLSEEINKRYNYDVVKTDVDYKLGQCDVLAENKYRSVYYEVKCSISEKSLKKSQKQLQRWSKYMKKYYKEKNYYGVLHSQNLTYLICKNGELRK